MKHHFFCNRQTVAAFLCGMLFAGAVLKSVPDMTAYAQEPKKEETVSIKADAEGNAYRVTSETVLSGFEEGKTITDSSLLKDILNTHGEEEYTLDRQGNLLWAYAGEEIRYEGTAKAEELPVGVRVSYYLDGRKLAPEEIAGKSGEVTIRFDYENHTRDEAYVPFFFLSVLYLEGDVFSEVEAENASVSRMDDDYLVFGYACPGLRDTLRLAEYEATKDMEIPAYVTVTARAERFSLDFTATLVTNGILAEAEEEGDDEEDRIDEMMDGLDDLEEASAKLDDAMRILRTGADAFGEGLSSYTDAVSQLSGGVMQLNAALSQMDLSPYGAAGQQIMALSAQLASGAQELEANKAKLLSSYDALREGIRKTAQGMHTFHEDGIRKLSEETGEDLKNVMEALSQVRSADAAYGAFSGDAKGAKGSTRFLIETDAVRP